MNPIKTTNAMNPAPAKGIESFPTPVIDDVVISEVVNAWKGNYEKLEYGTLWKDVSHAPNQGSFPEHKLVYQQPTSEDGQWVKRIWVNDRVNQDSYNYAIKYSAGSQEHPIYIRTYLVPRETYAPLLDGTPDPLFPAALLVDEEATRTEGELDSKYITVTRVYETIPGPKVPTKRYNERGDLETVIVQTVPPFTPPDPDGLLVTGSQVVQEEMGKGIKTTSTVTDHALLQIKEKREGLLGETVTTDDIVDPTSNPDDLSLNVVASSVEQYTATKARKKTTTSTGPNLLQANSLVNSPVGLVNASVTQSIEPKSFVPSYNNADGYNLISDEVSAIDSVKNKREKVSVSSWPSTKGRSFDEQINVGIPYTQSIVGINDVSSGNWPDGTDIKPIDQWKSLSTSPNLDDFNKALDEYYVSIPDLISVTLPDRLRGITVYWGASYASGQDFTETSGVQTGSYSLSISGGSKSSASIAGDVYFNIVKGYSGSIKALRHIFFIKIGTDKNINPDELVERLRLLSGNNGYEYWPAIKMYTENFVLMSGGRSRTTNTSTSKYASINGFGSSTGTGYSSDVDVRVNSIQIPVSLHFDLTIKEVFIGGEIPTELSPFYSINPKGIAETWRYDYSGARVSCPTFPTGSFIQSVNCDLYKYGWAKITAITAEITSDYV